MQSGFSLPKRTLTLWRLRIATVLSVPAGVLLGFGIRTPWLLLPAGVLLVLLAAAQVWYLPAFFSRYAIRVGDGAVAVYSGVIFRSCRIMPYPRLVCAFAITTPLSRAMKLSAVQLSAARGRIIIPELDADDAERLLSAFPGKGGDL